MLDSFELYKLRVGTSGKSSRDRILKDKIKSFEYALKNTYNAHDFEKNGQAFKAILSPNKLKLDYDEKVIAAPLSTNLKIGDVIHWTQTDTRWVVLLHHITEESYFRAEVKKALYKIKWRGDDGVVYEQWVALRGPVETKLVQESKKHLTFDVPNNTLTLWFGVTEGTKFLNRYDKIMVAGKVWHIEVVDDITTPGLVEMQLVEDIKDEDRDNVQEGIARDYENMIVETEKADYLITGLSKTNPIIGLIQTYSVAPFDERGVWSLDPLFGSIEINSGSEAIVSFNGKVGVTELTYSVDGEVKGRHKVNVTTMLG